MVDSKRFKKIFIALVMMLVLIGQTGVLAQGVQELTADSLQLVKLDEDNYKVIAKANVRLLYNDLVLTAEGSGLINRKTGDLNFEQDVKLVYQNYTISGQEMTGNIDAEKFVFSGEPTITGENLNAQAEQITYLAAKDLILLEGNASGIRNGQRFQAEKATFNLATENVDLTGQAKIVFPEEETEDDN